MTSKLEAIGATFAALRDDEVPMGLTTALVSELAPDEADRVVGTLALAQHHRELGRHGDVHGVLADEFGEEHAEAARRFADAFEVDHAAAKLIERRGGPDTSRALPALTSRDYVEAAFEAHQPNNQGEQHGNRIL